MWLGLPTRAAVPRRAQLQNEELEMAGRKQKRGGQEDSNAGKRPWSWDPLPGDPALLFVGRS